MWRRVLALAALLVGVLMGSNAAQADFRTCNQTGETVWTAFGYWDEDRGWISEGWFPLDDQYCRVNIVGDLENRYYYVYGEDEAYEKFWEASENEAGGIFCILDDDFEIEVDRYTVNDVVTCAKDMYLIKFIEIDVDGELDYTFNLTADMSNAATPATGTKGGGAEAPRTK